jgi:ribosomal protein S18 acetylase RimI-like enzyme
VNPDVAARISQATAGDLDAIRRIAAYAFDREPIQRAALADLLYHRPPEQPSLRLVARLGDGDGDADGDGDGVAGFAFGSVHNAKGFLDAIAVDPSLRHRGVAAALISTMQSNLVQRGAESFAVGDNTFHYAWPGVDLGYTAALSFLERAGYRRRGIAQNMEVDLDRWLPGTAPGVLNRRRGVVITRRAELADWPGLEAFIERHFSEVWRYEAGRAVHRPKPTAFLALRAEVIVGFACHGVYRRDWFGPIGTDPDERGSGIGEALLRLCLDDLAERGIAQAQIGWIGPMSFYSRTVGARCGRQFVLLEKDLRSSESTSNGAEEMR